APRSENNAASKKQKSLTDPVKRDDLPPTVPKTSGSSNDLNYTIAVYSLRGDLANRAVRFAEQTWASIPGDYVLELAPGPMVELLYSAPFRVSILNHANPHCVDPLLMYAV